MDAQMWAYFRENDHILPISTVSTYIMEELVCIMEPAIIFQKIMILVTMNIQGLACFGVESPNIIQILKVG